MTPAEFRATTSAGEPPAGAPAALAALWHEARGNWERAHELAQADGSAEGSWVHAYLHRKEGDIGNARYWYARAARPAFHGSLDAEWSAIAGELLARKARDS